MVTRRRLLGSVAGALASLSGVASAELGFPLGASRRRDAPHPDVHVAADGDRLYVAATDGDGTAVAALDGPDGDPVWRSTVGGGVRGLTATAEGLWVADDRSRIHLFASEHGTVETPFQRPAGRLGRPTPAGDGVAVAHNLRRDEGPLATDSVRGTVRMIDGGGERWSARQLGAIARPVTGGGGVYTAVIHREGDGLDEGRIVGTDASDGDRRWITGDVRATGALATAGDVVVAGCRDGAVRGFDGGTGEDVWRHGLEGAVSRLAVGPGDGEVVAAADDGAVVGLAGEDGERLWRYVPSESLDGLAVDGDTVWLYAGQRLTALRPHGDGVVWRDDVGRLGWPPAVVDGALVLPDDGAVVLYPGVERAAGRRLRALDASPLSALDPVAGPLGYDDAWTDAVGAHREGDHRSAYRAAGRARDRRRTAAAATGILGLGAVGTAVYAGDRLRLRWRRYRGLRRRHRAIAERIDAVEEAHGDEIPALRTRHTARQPGPLADPATARRELEELEELIATAEAVVDRRERLGERVREVEAVGSDHPLLAEALEDAREAVAAADVGDADGTEDVERAERRVREAEAVTTAIETIDGDALDGVLPLDEPPVDGVGPDALVEAVGGDLGTTATALDRLGELLDALQGRTAEDAAAMRRVGDDGLRDRYADAIRRGEVEELGACRDELDRRMAVADRRDALRDRLDGRSTIGGVPTEPLRDAVASVDVRDGDGAVAVLDAVERAVEAAERLAALEQAEVDVAVEEARESLASAVEAGDADAIGEAERDVERIGGVVERAERTTAVLDGLVLTHTDRDRDGVEAEIATAVADRDRHRLERIEDELGRLRDRPWTARRVAGMTDETFASLVAALWSTLGWDAEARWNDAVVAENGETLLIGCYPYPRDRSVQRDDVEHQVDRRRAGDADRLLVVTSSEPSDGLLATAEHGWQDVSFMAGDDLVDLLDDSPLVPPR